MKCINTKLAVALALGSVFAQAHAGFQFETAPAAPAQGGRAAGGPIVQASAPARNVDTSARLDQVSKRNRQRIDLDSRLSSRITQSGETPPELPTIRGMGRDVSFEDALRQILPASWGAYSDQDLPLESKVNWSGNRTWPMVLHTLLADRDMRAHIDWKNQEVMFFVPAANDDLTTPVAGALGVEVRGPSAGADTAAPQGVKPAAAVAVADAAKTASGDSARVKVEVKEVIWTLSPEFTLRENLRRWSTAANWNLVWNAVRGDSVIDYPVDAKVEFTGELLGSSGAMAKVITAYRDADYPLEIEFFRGNRVIEVRLHRIPDVKASPTDAQALVAPRVQLPAKPQHTATVQQDN